MKVADIVKNKIKAFPEGVIFGYNDFDIDQSKESALKIALYRLVKDGIIERLSKGRFYKPKQGITGNLRPDEYEIVKDLLFENVESIGYITGLGIFNRLGLTTQLSNFIQIGSNFDKKQIQRGRYTIKFIRQWNIINKKNVSILQLLDCIRFIKNIPDTSIDQSFKRLLALIGELQEKEVETLSMLALKYPSSTRAITGALLEQSGYNGLSNKLLKSLKSSTYYNINISTDLISNQKKWKIQ